MSKRQDKKGKGKKVKLQMSKVWTAIILVVALIDLQLSYILAFMGKEEIAETLSVSIVTEIVTVVLGYFIKSFKETKEAENIKLKNEKLKFEIEKLKMNKEEIPESEEKL